MLQEVRVDEKSLCCIDMWIEYADEALEEADRVERKRVQWAELVEVRLFSDEPENDSASDCVKCLLLINGRRGRRRQSRLF